MAMKKIKQKYHSNGGWQKAINLNCSIGWLQKLRKQKRQTNDYEINYISSWKYLQTKIQTRDLGFGKAVNKAGVNN